jgi:hypothetical protein
MDRGFRAANRLVVSIRHQLICESSAKEDSWIPCHREFQPDSDRLHVTVGNISRRREYQIEAGQFLPLRFLIRTIHVSAYFCGSANCITANSSAVSAELPEFGP